MIGMDEAIDALEREATHSPDFSRELRKSIAALVAIQSAADDDELAGSIPGYVKSISDIGVNLRRLTGWRDGKSLDDILGVRPSRLDDRQAKRVDWEEVAGWVLAPLRWREMIRFLAREAERLMDAAYKVADDELTEVIPEIAPTFAMMNLIADMEDENVQDVLATLRADVNRIVKNALRNVQRAGWSDEQIRWFKAYLKRDAKRLQDLVSSIEDNIEALRNLRELSDAEMFEPLRYMQGAVKSLKVAKRKMPR